MAALAITGALKTTATDTLEAHANLLPIPLLLQNTCHRAIVRLSTVPPSHPLHNAVRRAAKHYVASHRSSLHKLTHRYDIHPDEIETLHPAHRPPSQKHPCKFRIANSKEEAIREQSLRNETIQIYCDGSGHGGNIGAAAILFRAGVRQPRVLRFHLGTKKEHTVFEAEEVGLLLAAQLIASEHEPIFPMTIAIDNQAAILCGESFQSNPGSYLADSFRRTMQKVARNHDDFDVTIHWVPGHADIHGNEMADKEAKKAAVSRQNSSPRDQLPHLLRHGKIPLSISALIQAHRSETHAKWSTIWSTSPRHAHTHRIDPKILQRSFIKLTKSLPKPITSLLICLRTGHIPLNRYLHRIKKVNSPRCPFCPLADETVHHFLLECPHHNHARHSLTHALGRKASSIPFLLSNEAAIQPLARFVDDTRRLRSTFGEVSKLMRCQN